MRAVQRLLATSIGAAATFAALAAATAVGGPAGADPIGQCTSTHGAIVAVDFGHWSGPIVRGCGVDSPTGYELLHDAGFSTQGTQHDGPAFICRLGNAGFDGGTPYPTPDTESCTSTPSDDAYWSYWVAPAGQNSWSYSRTGATSDHPQPGEVEFWQYGATNSSGTSGRPSVTPAQLRAPAPAPSSESTPTARTSRTARPVPAPSPTSARAASRATHRVATAAGATPSRPAAVHRVPRVAHAGPVPRASHARSATSSPVSAAAAGSSGTTATRQPATPSVPSPAPRVVDAAPASAAARQPAGSPVPVLVGGLVVAALAGGAGWTAWRRRRAGTG